ncbi:hypothetical protein N5079_23565 [Planotetraspora sp. A-T 1434]|uniref:hypothetical protein n=1 Tax=Planotetraspora sp. A-T 1434 TaxID=2979219 RepID=UPI0021C097DF|nr:hypothetical protein [Planotetraspora sp. A-T 1434]MCT9933193.1 hypothetical protein [Planotetraspora sp. A-T 1434]
MPHRLARALGHLGYARRFLTESLGHYREAAARTTSASEAARDLRNAADGAHAVVPSGHQAFELLLASAERARATGDPVLTGEFHEALGHSSPSTPAGSRRRAGARGRLGEGRRTRRARPAACDAAGLAMAVLGTAWGWVAGQLVVSTGMLGCAELLPNVFRSLSAGFSTA